MLTLFGAAFVLSLSFAVQPGVIMVEATRRGITRGWLAALLLEVGSLVGDATWAIVAMLGVAALAQHASILGIFGGALLLYLGWQTWRQDISFEQAAAQPDTRADFWAGVMLSLTNPGNLTFWIGMSGTVVGLGFAAPTLADWVAFFTGFMIAQVGWSFFFAGLVGYGRRFINPVLFRYLNRLAALILIGFGWRLLLL